MGGTTAKASVIEDFAISRAGEFEIGGSLSQGSRLNRGSGFLLRVPAIDIAEIGAGGGSIVHVDGAGQLHVGPRSAGAVPGPACYDQGGAEATLTDANVVLGYLHGDRLPSGLRLDGRAGPQGRRHRPVAGPLGLAAARRGARRLPARLRADGPGRPRGDRRARPRPARLRDRRVRRQRPAVRRARWPPASASGDGDRPARARRVQRGRPARRRPRAPPRPHVPAAAARTRRSPASRPSSRSWRRRRTASWARMRPLWR